MKNNIFRRIFLCCAVALLSACIMPLRVLAQEVQHVTPASFGSSQSFNQDWLFRLGDDEKASAADYNDKNWRRLTLPHDWSIEQQLSPDMASCQGYLPGGIGWYRKHFTISDKTEKHYIYFEGVYNRSTVWINGQELGHRPNGYVSFMYDLTPYLKQGDNVLSVRVDHSRQADSRWYTGSGIYRNVWLIASGKTHLAQWGMGWQATNISDKQATIQVNNEIEGMEYAKQGKLQLNIQLMDADGAVVAKTTQPVRQDKCSAQLKVSKPKRWDLNTPYLYILRTELWQDGQKIDEATCRVGLRTLQFTANEGFFLNGRNQKVKGVCLHHDAGVLGAVVPREVWKRRLTNLKAMGANAIRMSHNPQAPDVYDLCDELGLLVMDEGSDEWEFPKRKWVKGWNQGTPAYEGTYDFFEEWIDRDIADIVRRDRVHPCIFLWSVGNEVDYPNDPYSHPVLDGGNATINQPMFGGYKPDAPNAERIGKIAKRLAAVIRSVDTSRPVTGALAGVVMSNQTEYPEAIDVVGYNYTENRYLEDHKLYPGRVIYGSETGVGLDSWKAVRDNRHIFGQFIWTGTDYLGESGAWPSRGLHTGLLDFGSNLKPRGWFRASLWSEQPMCYIGTYPIGNQNGARRNGGGNNRTSLSAEAMDTWNYEVGQTIRVVCYTNAPKARLLLNGSVVGEPKDYDDSTGIIYWDIPFAEGKLTAEGLDANGKAVSHYDIVTSGLPYQIEAKVLEEGALKEGQVAHVSLRILDQKGNLVRLADNEITARAGRAVRILGMENSNNSDMSNHRDTRERVYNGEMLIYIQKTADGKGTLEFSSPLLKKCTLEVE